MSTPFKDRLKLDGRSPAENAIACYAEPADAEDTPFLRRSDGQPLEAPAAGKTWRILSLTITSGADDNVIELKSDSESEATVVWKQKVPEGMGNIPIPYPGVPFVGGNGLPYVAQSATAQLQIDAMLTQA